MKGCGENVYPIYYYMSIIATNKLLQIISCKFVHRNRIGIEICDWTHWFYAAQMTMEPQLQILNMEMGVCTATADWLYSQPNALITYKKKAN